MDRVLDPSSPTITRIATHRGQLRQELRGVVGRHIGQFAGLDPHRLLYDGGHFSNGDHANRILPLAANT
jgi:hypothetical protein